MKRLLSVGGFTHDSQGVLTAVHRLAIVGGKCGPDLYFCFVLRNLVRFKLGIAALPNSYRWQWGFCDSQLAFLHHQSLAHPAGRQEGSRPVEIKRHHYLSD
jgi:hypothetical protein